MDTTTPLAFDGIESDAAQAKGTRSAIEDRGESGHIRGKTAWLSASREPPAEIQSTLTLCVRDRRIILQGGCAGDYACLQKL